MGSLPCLEGGRPVGVRNELQRLWLDTTMAFSKGSERLLPVGLGLQAADPLFGGGVG